MKKKILSFFLLIGVLFSAIGVSACGETIKPAEDGDGYVIRLYEPYNSSGIVKLKSAKKFKKVIPTDIIENSINNFNVEITDNGLEFNIKPFEIVTLKVQIGD